MQLFVTGFLLSLSLSLDLGTVNVAMVRTALQHGARPSFLLGLGSCLGDLAYALISLLALAAMMLPPTVANHRMAEGELMARPMPCSR